MDGRDIMAGMLILPTAPAAPDRPGSFATPMTEARIADLLTEERAALRARAGTGETQAQAILELGGDWRDTDIADVATAVMRALPSGDGPAWSPVDEADILALGFYGAALDLYARKRVEAAVMALAIMPWLGTREVEALCGLAICAAAANRLDDAFAFAMAALAHPEKSARACCIAGYCALKSGNRKLAQSLLATATRVARHNPLFRDDMRVAQRLLLTLHFD